MSTSWWIGSLLSRLLGPIAAACALTIPSGIAAGQGLKVAVVMADSETGGLFQSGFASALRGLGDVSVVGLDENPDYVLSGVVLCNDNNCKKTLSYSVALRLYAPMDRSGAETLADLAFGRRVNPAAMDSVVDTLWQYLKGYDMTYITWAVIWGRNRYEQGMREFIREIDSGCLDKLRAMRRAIASHQQEALKGYGEYVKSRKWLC